MISDLRNANAGMIAFTVMYPEPDRFGGDEVFASWVKDNGIVLSQTPSARGRADVAPYVGTAVLGEGDPYDFAYEYSNLVTNIPDLEKVAAGIGMVTSIISAITEIPVDKNVAMTGEITLRGNVLPIGGVKEKVTAAHRSGIKTIILPDHNRNDLEDIPEHIKKDLDFHFAKEMMDVVKVAVPGLSLNAAKKRATKTKK